MIVDERRTTHDESWNIADDRRQAVDKVHIGAFVFRRSSFVVVVVCALLLRLYRLDGQSLWLDELNTWWLVVNAPVSALVSDLWRTESAYPLYHLLLKGWIAVAGDSAWALRLPSALAGAGAVAAVYLAAAELDDRRPTTDNRRPTTEEEHPLALLHRRSSVVGRPLVASLLLAVSPFALWYAQEVKTYGLLLCTSALTVWLLLRALGGGGWRTWLAFGAVALVSVFVHRFALLLVLGGVGAWLSRPRTEDRGPRTGNPEPGTEDRGEAAVSGLRSPVSGLRSPVLGRVIAFSLLFAACVLLVWQMTQGLGDEGATTGEHIATGPVVASWITLWRFALDRGPWEAPWFWLVPGATLTLWGAILLLRDALRGDWRARALLWVSLLPLALFLAQLWWTRLYEPRYLMIVYPLWVLVGAYPFKGRGERREVRGDGRAREGQEARGEGLLSSIVHRPSSFVLLNLTLLASVAALLQPVKGLWSGDPVKEQYREAVGYIVGRAHPDDMVILHPEYLRTAWDYYAPRFTTGPLPAVTAFDAFKKNQRFFSQRDWDASRARALSGRFRSLLLIAPAHARTVDPINPAHPDDEYGLVGLYYRFSWEQNKWPCGGARFNGVHVLCQSSPEAYVTGEVAAPQVPLDIRFGDDIRLKGYRLGGGTIRAGSTLSVTLYWDVTKQPSEEYFVFLHLCQDCNLPPAASDDGPPLGGGVPTTIWKPGHPVHDERTVVLPKDLAPGRYTLLLGLYRPGDPTPQGRLPVAGGAASADNRVMISTVEVTAP